MGGKFMIDLIQFNGLEFHIVRGGCVKLERVKG